jgi:diacylglycerol kinase (ATP)
VRTQEGARNQGLSFFKASRAYLEKKTIYFIYLFRGWYNYSIFITTGLTLMLIKNKGLTRILYAFRYSYQGLSSALKNEDAFRQELLLFTALAIGSFYLEITVLERLVIIGSMLLVLIVELLNSAIECVVDRVGVEHHILSGRAKDYGSLAVFLSLIFSCSVWGTILLL